MYTLIEHKKLDTPAASIIFSNIPQNFTDLYLLISSVDSSSDYLFLDINASGTGHTFRNLLNELGSVVSYTQAAYGVNGFPISPMFSSNTLIASSSAAYIPNYTSGLNKSISADYVSEANSTSVIGGILAGLWSNTAAITSLRLVPSTGDIAANTSATLYGINRTQAIGKPKAIGGAMVLANGFWTHTFTGSGTFFAFEDIDAEYLVVAGGAGGGQGGSSGRGGGGGGAGGVLDGLLIFEAGNSYPITVGAGGPGAQNVNQDFQGIKGGASSIASLITTTGGGGGANGSGARGADGGSGGGNGGYNSYAGQGIPGQGNNGFQSSRQAFGVGAGGGGKGAASTSQTGGSGALYTISGASLTYGVGGNGGASSGSGVGASAAANTGNGGNGGNGNNTVGVAGGTGGAGGSGVVIVRYRA